MNSASLQIHPHQHQVENIHDAVLVEVGIFVPVWGAGHGIEGRGNGSQVKRIYLPIIIMLGALENRKSQVYRNYSGC